jgi:hypothetical protein
MSQYRATQVAAKSLIAQINSQCKLATMRCANRKIRYEINLKSKRTCSGRAATYKIYRLIPKHTSKSRETMLLRPVDKSFENILRWNKKLLHVLAWALFDQHRHGYLIPWLLYFNLEPGDLARSCNPSYLGGQSSGIV